MSISNKIVSMWIDGPLRLVDQVCLKSMVANKMDVTLYTYGVVNNVPDGINVANGEDVLSIELIKRLVPVAKPNTALTIQQFSDFFRIECQRKGLGMWLDSDTLLFSNFSYNTNKMYFAKDNFFRLGFSAIYLQKTNPICGDYLYLRSEPDLIPHWLGIKRRIIKPLIFTLQGKNYSNSDLGITIYGNDGFTRLVKRYDYFKYAKPKKWLYHWSGKKNYNAFKNYKFSEMLEDEECIGLHIHKKDSASSNAVPGSLWEWALNKYGP